MEFKSSFWLDIVDAVVHFSVSRKARQGYVELEVGHCNLSLKSSLLRLSVQPKMCRLQRRQDFSFNVMQH